MVPKNNQYNFNQQDYEFVVRIYNGNNDLYLSNESWEDLYIEEDIFDWKIKGSIVIKSYYDSFERESDEAITVMSQDKKNLVYKFRNDCRDTLFISIIPKSSLVDGLNEEVTFDDQKWRIETECVIYDVEDLGGSPSYKSKKLYFWEKTYQLMLERDSAFSTANTGSNIDKTNIDQLDNDEKSLTTGDALKSLLQTDDLLNKHTQLTTDSTMWDNGSDDNKIFYTSPNSSKFIDDLNYILQYTTSSKEDGYQPCIFKFERATKSMQPKQFSLKSIKKYFEKAGSTNAKEFQIEHFFIEEHSENSKVPYIKKSPISSSFLTEIKADKYNLITSYKISDFSGLDYSKHLANYRVVSYNSMDRQFNEEANVHKAEEYKQFFQESIKNNILTKNTSDRLIFTPYIEKGLNTKTIYSIRKDSVSRYADGRNRLINNYLFLNLVISFDVTGLTIRQPGRFFALSKLTGNDKEYDSKVEGQYFVTNVIHHFSNQNRSYRTLLTGVKTHTYKEETILQSSDVTII